MTERRRNLFILLFVAGLAIASIAIIATNDRRDGLDLQGGIELVYEASPTPNAPVLTPETLSRTIDIMRKRIDPTGTLEPEIQTSGSDQISIALPGYKDPDQAQRLVGKTARLYFYDWETNVIGPDGEPAPEDPEVTGVGIDGAGNAGAGIPLYDAVMRASKREPETFETRSHDGLFYLVDEKNKKVLNSEGASKEADLFSDDAEEAAKQREQFKVVKVPVGTVVLQADVSNVRSGSDKPQGRKDSWYVLRDNVALQGSDITDPAQISDNSPGAAGAPAVSFNFTSDGRKVWEEVTREIAQRGQEQSIGGTGAQHFAIALDNQLISVPQIDPVQNPDGISGANGSQISGGFTLETARDLADLLRTGALPVELELISQSEVSATLGEQALDEAVVAGAAGFLVVALFLLIFYRVLGVLAISGLVLYSLFFYALVVLIPVTLTLPGIAGLILTIGVAADANIVIFERIKEELRSGRSTQAAISAGYKRGLTAIVDANVVTFIVAFILFTLATANVKAFAFVLGVGTLVSFFTAVVYTQAVLGVLGRSKVITGRAALGAGTVNKAPRRFDFMGRSKIFFSGSGLILVVGALFIGTQGVPLGIDFESGTRITTGIEQQASEADMRAFMADQGFADAKVQRISNEELGAEAFQIAVANLQPEEVLEVRRAMDSEFGVGESFSSTSVGPTFGAQIANTAIIAIIASLLVISGYIALRFEWKYAVPVLIAITHDILIVAGIYAALGAEVTSATVAALLTILGYSLYDTIIVFDRIRENVPRMPRATYSQIVNQSMSEVLTRSLATSFCTLLPVITLYFFGGETLKEFALALIIGTLSGVYSSIFIAGPVLVHWKERETVWKRRAKAVAADHGGLIPSYADAPKQALADSAGPRGPVRLSSDQPDSVSPEEFEAMVRDLGIEDAKTARSARTAASATATKAPEEETVDPNDPASVRRAEARRRREQRQTRKDGDS
ncbi:MAG: protein translocase subunit SecD [Solirubrobacteraceae bacterium]|nr:protein translocase subunit SecD [Solirubrobacteraceae bacterium]